MTYKRGFYDVFVRTCAKFPSRIAITVYEDEEYKSYTYSELYGVCEYIAQHLQQLNCNKGIMGIVSSTNIIIPCMAAAAHKCCTSFMFLDPAKDLEEIIEDMKFTVVISIIKGDESIKELLCKPPDKCLFIFGMCICFYNYSQLGTPSHYAYSLEHSFIAMTSGSTGDPKKIQVPVRCIQPNITDLTTMFQVAPDDVVYFSTPLTFDPSMVEILLSGMNGASLLIAPPKIEILFTKNKEHSVTIWQTTPSKFFQFSNINIKNTILCKNSSLRILALGGEPLNGVKRLKELKHKDNKTRIFTLYGVTEMSCWACVAELDLNKTFDHEVPLGKCLSETKVVVSTEPPNKNTGKIILVSDTRKCIIMNNKNSKSEMSSLKFIDTGDIGELSGNGTIYYRGRKDDVIKRFGHKINLQFIESTVMHCPRIRACACIWLPKPSLLIVYFTSDSFSSQDLSDFLKCKLDDKHWPDRTVRVDNIPTSPHGKMSKMFLMNMNLEKSTKTKKPRTLLAYRCTVFQEIRKIIKSNMTYGQIKNKDFFSIGGSSFLAVSMCNNIAYTHPEFGRRLLPELLNQSQSIDKSIILAEQKSKSADDQGSPKRKKLKVMKSESERSIAVGANSLQSSSQCISPSRPQRDTVEFVEMWTHNTGKCVDATPAILQCGLNLYVTIGSHSGKVTTIDAMTGIVVGVIDLKSRVEASVCCYAGDYALPALGVVGAYDGTIVCYAIETCEELWRTNINSMIKSKAVICNRSVYVAAYDGAIRCFSLETGELRLRIMVGDQAISADLVMAKNSYIMVGTLGGVCCGVDPASSSVAWRSVLGSPVFANPAVYDDKKYVIFAEVSGELHCRTVQKGILLWSYSEAKGNIFSSVAILERNKSTHEMVFGCHDNCVYNVVVKNFQPTLQWKVALKSPVYATPCFLNDKLILAAASDGVLTIISNEYTVPIAEYSLPGDTFSSPSVYKDYIFIGCRNDLVYSLRYV